MTPALEAKLKRLEFLDKKATPEAPIGSYVQQVLDSITQQHAEEMAKLHRRVAGVSSGDCPFCNSYSGDNSHSQPCPMCRLCELESNRDSLREQLRAKTEEAAILQSQVDNADVNLEQVRMAMKSNYERELRANEERVIELEADRGIFLSQLEELSQNWKDSDYSDIGEGNDTNRGLGFAIYDLDVAIRAARGKDAV